MLLLITLSPLVGALLILFGAPARRTALIAAAVALVATVFAFVQFRNNSGFNFVTSLPIAPQFHLTFTLGLDGLSLLMVLLAAIVTMAAVWFAGTIERSESAYYICLLLISGGTIGAFASLDLFFFYAFHELALIPTFLLIGIWGSGNRTAAAWKVTIYLGLGSFVLLIGLIMLYQSLPAASQTFDIRQLKTLAPQISPVAQQNIFLVLLIGFGSLISLFPFHSWAPEAYASAPAPAAMLHAGVLKKFGLYGLLRLALPLLPAGLQHWTWLLIVLLLGNIIYIGLATIAQRRLDWMLGYSSVMHMGYIFLGVATANVLGTTGAAVLMFAHGLSIALLFAIAGEVRKRTGTLVFEDLGGLAKVMPLAGLAFGFGSFAAIGLPGFANFAAEIMVFFSSFHKDWEIGQFHTFQLATLLALWGVVISAVYMLRAYRATFMGSMPDRWKDILDLKQSLRLPLILLIGGLLWFGFFPQTLVRVVSPAFKASLTNPAP
ncbi:MAG: NuoM family protein [Chthoniobacterales bacterium]